MFIFSNCTLKLCMCSLSEDTVPSSLFWLTLWRPYLNSKLWLSRLVLSFLSSPDTWSLWSSINRERAVCRCAERILFCPDLVLLFLCNKRPLHSFAWTHCRRVYPCHCMPVFHLLSLCVSVLPSLSVFFLFLSLSLSFPHASVRSSCGRGP